MHKKGNTKDPSNFRPIALTSVVAKLFHKILAMRLEEYFIQNSIIDKSLQKGFLKGVNGCVEHVFAVQCIFGYAQENSLPLALDFIDLRNAFGSVAHSNSDDILRHIDLPSEFRIYVHNLYSLSAHIFSKNWKTQSFNIKLGVFQNHRSFFSLLSTLSFSQ